MPTKEVILDHVQNLQPFSRRLSPKLDNREIWAGKAYEASFELTNDGGYILGKDIPCLTLFLRGKQEGKNKLIEEFIVALGEPILVIPARRFRNPQTLLWDISDTYN